MRFPFFFRRSKDQKNPSYLAERLYAIDDQQHSNISYREAESALLSELGLPHDPQDLKYGDAIALMDYLWKGSRVVLDERTIHAVRTRRYSWRHDISDANPETALYLDAYARLNEIHDNLYSEHDKRARAFKLLREGGHI